MKRVFLSTVLLIAVAIVGCSEAALPPTTASLPATLVAATPLPTDTAAAPAPTTAATVPASPTAVPTRAPSRTSAPTTPTVAVTSSSQPFIDDRSTPQSLLRSYVSALNRQEYARAYSYWDPGAPNLQPFDQFKQGYADTASVELTVGNASADAGAGNIYTAVPVVLTARTKSGTTQTFVGCYVTHQAQPGLFSAPLFRPLGLNQAKVQVNASPNPSALLSTICQDLGYPAGNPVPAQPNWAPNDISSNRYLDDRSDPVQVIRSFYNAINRKEYARAYWYWQPEAAASQLAPYDQFQQGYADTLSVQLSTGTVTSNAGAGQIYYNVPVTLMAQTTGGATQTFVGCYTVHLARPEIQSVPPYQPMGITAAMINLVKNGANTSVLMNAACH